ncbi:hypothetical protein [Vibrio mediterranei]|uniref:Uncharacterized protein n=1 Tax=Vibrio mediterranei TaxID=689 RepID=A0ABX5D730_9VIBR|nr:hypothetical protein [Vibrio mediterranei]PCD85519.1 hypothetical protein COR52_26295 [Vibrio mediterranei]PRQ65392.1 hypothetical protein COR51_22475 [Vibrio mediterranei]
MHLPSLNRLQTLRTQAILTSAATLIFIQMENGLLSFDLTHWIALGLYSSLLLISMYVAPKWFPPKSTHERTPIHRATGIALMTLALLICSWLQGFTLSQTLAFALSFALLVLGLNHSTEYRAGVTTTKNTFPTSGINIDKQLDEYRELMEIIEAKTGFFSKPEHRSSLHHAQTLDDTLSDLYQQKHGHRPKPQKAPTLLRAKPVWLEES